MIQLAQEKRGQHIPVASIKVVGIGGAGGNTVNCMIRSGYNGVEFIVINTDLQALELSDAHKKIQIGLKSSKGLGAGANPEVGKRAAEEDLDKILAEIEDADIVFLAAGMGGGTGSGALPVVVKALKDKGILTIVVVTKPFGFEGKKRAAIAEEAIKKVREFADTLLIVPNQKLIELVDDKVSMIEGFEMINEVLNQSVKGVSDIITRAGHINVDFADVREIMKGQGLAVMGTGRATGTGRARTAALAAISSPLLENMSIAGARGVLLNISGSSSLGLHEISEAASVIYEQADQDANIILGSVIDDTLGEELSVTVIATGFNNPVKNETLFQGPIPVKVEVQTAAPVAAPVLQEAVFVQPVQQQAAPVQVAPVQAVPVEAVPAQAAPVYAAPVEVIQVQAAPIQAAALEVASVQAQPEPVMQHVAAHVEETLSACVSTQEAAPVQVCASPEKTVTVHQDAPVQQNQAVYMYAPQEAGFNQDNSLLGNDKGRNSGLGSNVIQLNDVDVPTFMRKPQQFHNNKNNHKHGHNQNNNQQSYKQQHQRNNEQRDGQDKSQ